jgi:queuine/archaeosine tRNA-ribosyltransferase
MVSDRGANIETTNGRKEITPDMLVETSVRHLKPDFLISLSDDPASSCGSKRVKKSVDRNVKWYNDCKEKLLEQQQQQQQSSPCVLPQLIGVVNGGLNPYESKRCIESVMLSTAAAGGSGGFVMGSIGCGETPEERTNIVNHAKSLIDSSRFRLTLNGFVTPSEV